MAKHEFNHTALVSSYKFVLDLFWIYFGFILDLFWIYYVTGMCHKEIPDLCFLQ